jgi:hypothetical protein
MFKLKGIMKTANEVMGEKVDEKDLNIRVKPPHLCSSNGYYRRNKWHKRV